jgi:hypothetical protein
LIPVILMIWYICNSQQSTQRGWSWFASHIHSLTFKSHFFNWSHRDLAITVWQWNEKLKTHLSSEDISPGVVACCSFDGVRKNFPLKIPNFTIV